MAGEFAAEEGQAVQNGRAAEMRRSIDAVNAVRAGRTGNPAMVDAAAAAEAALKMGAGPRSADFARVRRELIKRAVPTLWALCHGRHSASAARGPWLREIHIPCSHRCCALVHEALLQHIVALHR